MLVSVGAYLMSFKDDDRSICNPMIEMKSKVLRNEGKQGRVRQIVLCGVSIIEIKSKNCGLK